MVVILTETLNPVPVTFGSPATHDPSGSTCAPETSLSLRLIHTVALGGWWLPQMLAPLRLKTMPSVHAPPHSSIIGGGAVSPPAKVYTGPIHITKAAK